MTSQCSDWMPNIQIFFVDSDQTSIDVKKRLKTDCGKDGSDGKLKSLYDTIDSAINVGRLLEYLPLVMADKLRTIQEKCCLTIKISATDDVLNYKRDNSLVPMQVQPTPTSLLDSPTFPVSAEDDQPESENLSVTSMTEQEIRELKFDFADDSLSAAPLGVPDGLPELEDLNITARSFHRAAPAIEVPELKSLNIETRTGNSTGDLIPKSAVDCRAPPEDCLSTPRSKLVLSSNKISCHGDFSSSTQNYEDDCCSEALAMPRPYQATLSPLLGEHFVDLGQPPGRPSTREPDGLHDDQPITLLREDSVKHLNLDSIQDSDLKFSNMLGSGGFSTVHRYRDDASGRIMAIKKVSRWKGMDDAKAEVAILEQLNHPNVIQLLGAVEMEENFLIYLEWMPGSSVQALLRESENQHFSEYVIQNYSYQLLNAVVYLHASSILHRDIKGANLLVDSTGRILKICDFGLARTAVRRNGRLEVPNLNKCEGTYNFMAPELVQGKSFTSQSDMWAVGCTMLQMATGKEPWAGFEYQQVIFKIGMLAPLSIPDWISHDLVDLISRCLQTDADRRPHARDAMTHCVFRDVDEDYATGIQQNSGDMSMRVDQVYTSFLTG